MFGRREHKGYKRDVLEIGEQETGCASPKQQCARQNSKKSKLWRPEK
jgi:hypothetical protein